MTKAKPRLKPAHFFADHPIFTFDEFVESEPTRPIGTVKALLRYHSKRGNLVRVRRGLYMRDDFFDPFLIASRLAPDAIIAYDSALLLMRDPEPVLAGLERVSFLTASARISRETFADIAFKPIAAPPVLGKRWRTSGVICVERSGMQMSMTSPERTIVDVLDRIALAPPATELWELLALGAFDPELMVAHARALKSQIVFARLGFLLEYLPTTPRKLLATLERLAPKSPVYFDRPRQKGQSAFINRWNLVATMRLYQTVFRTDFRGRTPSLPKETELPD